MNMRLHHINAIARLLKKVPQLQEFAMMNEPILEVGLRNYRVIKLPVVETIKFANGRLDLRENVVVSNESGGRQSCYILTSGTSVLGIIPLPAEV